MATNRQLITEFLRRNIPDGVRNWGRPAWRKGLEARLRLRAMSGAERISPSFLIVGAMKAGTTSMFRYLEAHPHVGSPVVKEINYFNFNWSRPESWYQAHFPRRKGTEPSVVTGEASPGYLTHPQAADRVARRLPDVKIIVMLRNPVDRALSHYFHERRAGRESRGLHEAMLSKDAWAFHDLRPDEERAWYDAFHSTPPGRVGSVGVLSDAPLNRAYLAGGCYSRHLEPWFETFDRTQILVLNSDDMFRSPEVSYMRTLEFLDLEPIDPCPNNAFNVGKRARIAPEIVEYLEDVLAEPNQRLLEMTGIDFGWERSYSGIAAHRPWPELNAGSALGSGPAPASSPWASTAMVRPSRSKAGA